MKRMAMIAASALLLGRGLAAQDTTKAAAPAPAPPPAPPPPPPAPPPSVTARAAVVAKSVPGRQPQDNGSAIPAADRPLHSRTTREGARGAGRRCRRIGPEPGTSK